MVPLISKGKSVFLKKDASVVKNIIKSGAEKLIFLFLKNKTKPGEGL